MQGLVLEQLPINILTVTRAQVRILRTLLLSWALTIAIKIEQLKSDNIISPFPAPNYLSFQDLVESNTSSPLKTVHDILPEYI